MPFHPFVLLSAALLLAAACDRPTETPQAAPATVTPAATAAPVIARYLCDDGRALTLHYQDDRAEVHFPDHVITLPLAISASGARFSDGETTAWNKGRDLMLDEPGKERVNCHEESGPGNQPETASK